MIILSAVSMWRAYLFTFLLAMPIFTVYTSPIRTKYSDFVITRDQTYKSKRSVSDYMDTFNQLKRHKRLMGIFRCNGWGPGCTHFNDPVQSTGRKAALAAASSGLPMSSRSRFGGGWNRHGKVVFEPFFTLTSGGSWGPTGKKRSAPPTDDSAIYRRIQQYLDDEYER